MSTPVSSETWRNVQSSLKASAVGPGILSDVVGTIQKRSSGVDLNMLVPTVCYRTLILKKGSYLPRMSAPNETKVRARLVYHWKDLPARFEHLLQDARAAFPGMGFDRLTICFKKGYLTIRAS